MQPSLQNNCGMGAHKVDSKSKIHEHMSLSGVMRNMIINENTPSYPKKGFGKTRPHQASSNFMNLDSHTIEMPELFSHNQNKRSHESDTKSRTGGMGLSANSLQLLMQQGLKNYYHQYDRSSAWNEPLEGGQFNSDSHENALYAGCDYPTYSSSPKIMMQVQDVEMRGSVATNGRKNRVVEMTTIGDGTSPMAMVMLSDPNSVSVPRSTHLMNLPLTRPGAPRNSEMSLQVPGEAIFSRKVFVGGLPIDVKEEEVWSIFAAFGKVLVDWPRRPDHGRENGLRRRDSTQHLRHMSGYVFLVYDKEESVQRLIDNCVIEKNKYFLFVSSPTMSDKPVQVRAWRLADIDYFADDDTPIDHRRTVFIGGVPRPTRAIDLARCLEVCYGAVSYVGIDIDPELKYPKGAARVTFATSTSLVRAISGRFVQVNHTEVYKRVEIKPYVMDDQICDECEGKLCRFSYAPYFCGDASCLQYYCEACWDRVHYVTSDTRADHKVIVRKEDQTKVLDHPLHHGMKVMGDRRQSTYNYSVGPSVTRYSSVNRGAYLSGY